VGTFRLGGTARLWSGGDKLSVTAGGNVGIGTSSPQRPLHVEGNEIHSGGAGAGLSFANRGSAFVNQPTAGERWVLFASGGTARLWSGGDKLAVTAAGNVGIGTTTPAARLHVEGTVRSSRSGKAVFAAGNDFLLVPVAGISSESLVFAVAQSGHLPGVAVKAASPVPASGTIALSLTAKVPTNESLTVAWFILN
jgi:hypothetical protein